MDVKAARSEAWAALACKALPLDTLVTLLRAFGEPSAILDASRSDLAAVVPRAAVSRLKEPLPEASTMAIRAWLAEPGNELVAWDDPEYPRALLELGHAPPVLYFVGRRELLNRPALAIVGSRNATPQGLDNARAFARALSDAGLTIISGLALGIDAAAHEGALDGSGATLAVVGTGLDRVYPARHRELAHTLAARGGLLSEFPPGTPARASNFPRRNRLISGLARGVLVVEAALSSGSLITARYAGEQGREVFAIPGSIHSPLARGCHKLIREGAKLVETAQDVLAELGLADRAAPLVQTTAVREEGPRAALLGALAADPADLDCLAARTGLSTQALCANLMALELDGKVVALPGGRWQRRP
ncbi:MAG: DNA-processing protein DprA [Casimicrobiaceae bacterium]